MTKRNPNYLIITLLLLAFVASVPFLKKQLMGESTQINISDNKNELSISGAFPGRKSKMVHDYLRKQLNLSDLPDLTYLEIKHYQTPDLFMSFYIKSRVGYLKILFDKNENSSEAYNKMKKMGEGLKEVLVNR